MHVAAGPLFVFRGLFTAYRVQSIVALLYFQTKLVPYQVAFHGDFLLLPSVAEGEAVPAEKSVFGVRDKDSRDRVGKLKVFATGVEPALVF